MVASLQVFSLEGKGLRLDSAQDIEPHIQPLKDNADVEEVHLQGNTFGIEASKALAAVLEQKKNLRVGVDSRFSGVNRFSVYLLFISSRLSRV